MQAVTQQMVEGGVGGGSALNDHPTQSATTIDGWPAILFGLPFLAIGLFLAALGTGVVAVHTRGGASSPTWLIGLIGGMFGCAGLFVVGHGVRGVLRKMAYRRESALHAGQIWYADHHWSKQGASFSAFKTMLGRLLAALGWYVFLVPFLWVGLTQRGTWIFTVGAGFFGLAGIVFWVRWAKMLGELIRYGNSYLSYDQFPYFLGGTLTARLRAPRHVNEFDELTLILRCVTERYVTSGSGRNRNSAVVCYELYRDEAKFTSEQLAAYAAGEIPMQFRVPAEQPTTALIATPPTYWEVEARGSSKTVNYQAYFLVPVYAAR